MVYEAEGRTAMALWRVKMAEPLARFPVYVIPISTGLGLLLFGAFRTFLVYCWVGLHQIL